MHPQTDVCCFPNAYTARFRIHGFCMKHLIKEIAEHIVRVSFKVKFVIAAVVSASAERVSIRTAVRISTALLAVRAGSLVERRESELIVHFLLFRIA